MHFHWSENLSLSQYQLSKHFSKIFFWSTVIIKIFGPKLRSEKPQRAHAKKLRNYVPTFSDEFVKLTNAGRKTGFLSWKRYREPPTEKLSKIVLLLLGLKVIVLGSIVTEMKTQSLAHCTFMLKKNVYKKLMVMSATGQL